MLTHNLRLKDFCQCEAGESAGFLHKKEDDRELSKQGNMTRMKDLSAAYGYLLADKPDGVF